jgi:3-oxoacyl-[acyl-carrier protein] reductase
VRVIITGGATGIGKSCVECIDLRQHSLSSIGVNIDIIYFSSHSEAIKLKSDNINIHKVDVTDENQVKYFFDTIGSFDILINNAGGNISFNSTDKYLLEDWNKTYELNTTSVFLMCKYGIPVIKDGGKIINISSISAKSGGAEGGMAYASSKAAVDCMTKSLAKELASRNICVNAVSPGVVYTKQHEKFSSEEYYNSLIEKIPLGRDGKTSDISNLVTFLCSDESNYITGQVIEINGGMLMK